MSDPTFRAGSILIPVAGPFLVVVTWSELCGLLAEVLELVAIFAGKGPTLGRLCFAREKNEAAWVGNLDVLDAEDSMGGLGDGPNGTFSFDSGLPDCFADLKPNAPREAIVAAWLPKHVKKLERRRT